MKIHCECGQMISDNTDYISYKAWFVADQDFYDLLDAVDGGIAQLAERIRQSSTNAAAVAQHVKQVCSNVRDLVWKYAGRVLYQCPGCARLYVDDRARQSQVFLPEKAEGSGNLLGSIEGAKWKRPLRGSWQPRRAAEEKGELWWGPGDEDAGFELFRSWELLQERYQEVFTRLEAKGILRDAFLCKGDELVHQWPPRQ